MVPQGFFTGPKLIILGVVGFIGVAVLSALILFVYVRLGCGEDLNQTSEQFAGQAIASMTQEWDHETVLNLMPRQAREDRQTIASLRDTCSSLATVLGNRTAPLTVRGQAVGRMNLRQKAFATASYSSRCQFERGSATISVDLVKDLKLVGPNGPWLLVNIRSSGLDQ